MTVHRPFKYTKSTNIAKRNCKMSRQIMCLDKRVKHHKNGTKVSIKLLPDTAIEPGISAIAV